MIKKLITDFDETISVKDTISLIVHAAIDSGRAPKSPTRADWEEMVQWYITRYRQICDAWLRDDSQQICGEARERGSGGAGERGSGGARERVDEYPHTRLPAYPPTHTPAFHSEIRNPKPEIIRLVEFLQAFEPLERASIERVVEKGFLAGLTKATLREIGQNVVRNKTVDATLHALRARGVEIEVLSANWSTALIEGAMEGCCDHVIANCLVYDETGVSTGDIQLRVVSAQDKLRWFRQRRAQPGQTLYIGDSISDLLAILDADIGILIGNNRIAMWTIERFSLPTQRLTKKTQFDPTLRYQGTILLVESWETLTSFISDASSGVSQPGLTSV